jgi:uncharacterized membrane protein
MLLQSSRQFLSHILLFMRLSIVTYVVILLAVVVWCGGIVLAPFCCAEGGTAMGVGQVLYQFYHPICHQRPERSLFLAGHPLAVCARCTSIYFAFLVGTLLFPLFRSLRQSLLPPRWLLIVVAVPMLIDAMWIGPWLYHVTILTRMISGALLGLVLPFFLLPSALQAVRELFSNVDQQKGFSHA